MARTIGGKEVNVGAVIIKLQERACDLTLSGISGFWGLTGKMVDDIVLPSGWAPVGPTRFASEWAKSSKKCCDMLHQTMKAELKKLGEMVKQPSEGGPDK